VTEADYGIANLGACRSIAERQAQIRAVAGYTPVGPQAQEARDRGIAPTRHLASCRGGMVGVEPSEARPQPARRAGHKGAVRWSNGSHRCPPPAIRRLVDPEHGEVRKGVRQSSSRPRGQAMGVAGVVGSGNLEVCLRCDGASRSVRRRWKPRRTSIPGYQARAGAALADFDIISSRRHQGGTLNE